MTNKINVQFEVTPETTATQLQSMLNNAIVEGHQEALKDLEQRTVTIKVDTSDVWTEAELITFAFVVHDWDESGDATIDVFLQEIPAATKYSTVDFALAYLDWAQGPGWQNMADPQEWLANIRKA